jgi:hypothetical protein
MRCVESSAVVISKNGVCVMHTQGLQRETHHCVWIVVAESIQVQRLLFHLLVGTIIVSRWCCLEVQDIVASNENVSQKASKLTINEFFRSFQVQIHVGLRRVECSLILHLSPFKLDNDDFTNKVSQEGFGINNELRLVVEERRRISLVFD